MRIRTIKPEFWSHPVTGRWSGELQAFAISLLNISDDEGFFYGDAASVRSAVRPFDDDSKTTLGLLDECSRQGWIERVKHPERGPICRVVNFSEHQRIDKPKPSKIAPYFNDSKCLRVQDESKTIPRRVQDESQLERKGKEQGKEGKEFAPAERAPRESDRLCDDFEKLVGEKYSWQGAKDGTAFAKLRKEFSLDEILDRWRKGLRASGWQQVRTVAQLASKWNDLAGEASSAKPDWLKKRNEEQAKVHIEGEVRL